ncbi:hypothetical protein [Alteromonas gilva]|uniref:Uncharacterized protein n=1 Tax=Alteromonas gilva TaxID=2987522 RepID=A0ABT5KY74_9ALTE|nr:hypothetical protein [Alteromonas gilva]MDC8829711.1 hypothetical protein [Alteromonas gilva]
MAKHLTDDDIEKIVDILDNWSVETKLTWDRLVDSVQHGLGIETTRQTLSKQKRIKDTFKAVKAIVSGNTKPVDKTLPSSLKIAAQRIEALERKVERLERENHELLEQFHVWLYNADRLKITIEQLNSPLPRKTH